MGVMLVKRVYDAASPEDGWRVLVDRLWPRGLSKNKAAIDYWDKEIAPSNELRHWFSHDPAKWDEFKSRYRKELDAREEFEKFLREVANRDTVTLLYAAKDTEHNNALALLEFLQKERTR